MTNNADDVLRRTGFVDESHLSDLVAGDRAAGEQEVGAGSPVIISAVSGTVASATAVSALVTSSGLCPTFSCTGEC
ncbi:hypothetical protein [Rathayibacter sp. AY1A3]|nr:hypothetical protein [Rathayibacter sp. AY1A3]